MLVFLINWPYHEQCSITYAAAVAAATIEGCAFGIRPLSICYIDVPDKWPDILPTRTGYSRNAVTTCKLLDV